jgi:UDP-glucuronate decarboxylase
LIDRILSKGLSTVSRDVNSDFFEGASILIAGGGGFIGSWLCDIFVSSQTDVCCVDDFSTGLERNVGHLTGNGYFVLKKADICKASLRQECNYILHFASRPSPEEYQRHPVETMLANSTGTYRLLELARKNDAILVYASSSEVYGDPEPQDIPTAETFWGRVNPIGPRSCYDEGKRFSEALCLAYHRAYGLDTRIVRIFNTYGPRIRADGAYARAVPRFIKQALSGSEITVYGTGMQTRAFTYITDTLAGIMQIIRSDRTRGEVLNIGNTNETSIMGLAKLVRKITKSNSKIVKKALPLDDPRRRCADISKAKSLLGWKPVVSLETGLADTIEWFKLNSKWV